MTLLQEIGLLPELSVVTSTQQEVKAEDRYALSADAGVLPARDEENALTGAALVGLQAALEHGSLAALQHACRQCLAALRLPLRAMIQHHVGNAPLRTRQVMRDLQSL